MAIAIGPIVGGVLLDHFWWGSVFLINVPVTGGGRAAIVLFVPESKSPLPGRIDYLGVLLSIVGLVLVVYGIIRAATPVPGCRVCSGRWLAGWRSSRCSGWHEARTEHPNLDVRLFRDPRLSSAGGDSAGFFAMAGVYFFISFYLQNVRGLQPAARRPADHPRSPRASCIVLAAQRRPGTAIRCRAASSASLRDGRRADRLHPLRHHANLGARGGILRPGRGHGHDNAAGHRSGDVGVPRERGGGRRSRTPPARWRSPWAWPCSGRCSPRSTGAGVAAPGRAAGRYQGRGHPVDRGDPGRRATARLGAL